MEWMRLALIAATTLAASKLPPILGPKDKEYGTCGPNPCSRSDPLVRPEHILFPLGAAGCIVLFANVPTLLLASQTRIRDLTVSTMQVVFLTAVMGGTAALYLVCPSWAYALSCHVAALIITRPAPPTLLMHRQVYSSAQSVAIAVVVVWAAQLGPALPVLDSPGMSGCCGARSHLLAWAVTQTVGEALVLLGECLLH